MFNIKNSYILNRINKIIGRCALKEFTGIVQHMHGYLSHITNKISLISLFFFQTEIFLLRKKSPEAIAPAVYNLQ